MRRTLAKLKTKTVLKEIEEYERKIDEEEAKAAAKSKK